MNRVVLVASLVILAGCAGAATFDTGRSSNNTSRISFATIAGGRDMHTQIFGNPFAVPNDFFADSVTAVFNNRNSRARSNFTTRSGPSARENFRLVLVFNPAQRGLASRLCRNPTEIQLAASSSRPIRLQIAFCHGDTDITSRRGSLPDATGPEDPAFRNFLAQALQLTQPRNDKRRPLD
ncbi:MAG: hypothetical protein ACTSWM_02425 [Alphaproteobacteria bacterium]